MSCSSVLVSDVHCTGRESMRHYSFCLLQKLVVKPDQLIKRRGKLGLIKVNADFAEVKAWVAERLGKDITVS